MYLACVRSGEMKLISVIIPAYNVGEYIERCIFSILGQTYKRFEIIIVDDGSTDDTMDIVNKISLQHDNIYLVSQANSGVSAARNKALEYAHGDFIVMVDADDDMPETALETMINLMTDEVDLVIGSHNEINIFKNPKIHNFEYFEKDDLEDCFDKFDHMIWYPWAKMFRRCIIFENDLRFDTNTGYGEDHIFNLAYAKAMKGAAVSTNVVVYNYYIRKGVCTRYYPDMNQLQLYVLNNVLRFWGNPEKKQKYRIYYTGCYLTGCIYYYIAWCSISEATTKIKETFQIYEKMLDEQILNSFFSKIQRKFISNEDFERLLISYIIKNPKGTVGRKVKRNIKSFLKLYR